MALLRVLAVELVVRRHDGPRGALPHRDLEVLEIDFAQGPFTHDGIVFVTVGFLVVGREVLDGRSHAI